MQLHRLLINPPLQPLDPLLPDRSLLIQPIGSSVRRPNLLLQLLDRRPQLARSGFFDEVVGERVDFGGSKGADGGGVVEGEAFDSEETVVEEPFGEEALWEKG